MARDQFSNSTPAAPTGADNVTWQADDPPADPTTWRSWSAYIWRATASLFGTIKLALDLGGSAALPKVVGIQGTPVDGTAPTDGQVLLYNGGAGKWQPADSTVGYRRVGITIDGAGSAIVSGPKGSIQLDFPGTIVGWSIEGDRSGSISIDVAKHSGTQTAPVVPAFPGDKISASAPIALASAQTAGVDATGVSTWTTAVAQWDSIAFYVSSAMTVQRVTLWLRILAS